MSAQISPYRCLFQASIGGLGLVENEHLIRFTSRSDEISALLSGALSLTRAELFLGADSLEGDETEEDKRWRENFFGDSASYSKELFRKKRNAILASSYVSCWHRISTCSEIERLGEDFLGKKEFQFAITTSVERVLSSILPPDGTPMWLDFFGVR